MRLNVKNLYKTVTDNRILIDDARINTIRKTTGVRGLLTEKVVKRFSQTISILNETEKKVDFMYLQALNSFQIHSCRNIVLL